ncbi:MAG TPA: UvrB/UvrC motif-containing protein [Gemmatales bacterium]|nr:UvrB/UvrC motif-containing protein [Gemmatales bacterium]
MKTCERCGEVASIHLCHPVAGQDPLEVHLCTSCAEKANVIVGKDLQLSTVVQMMIGKYGQEGDVSAKMHCPVCGLPYAEFRRQGRLGCPHDYEAFRSGLIPLLERIHRKTVHVGKRPRQRPRISEVELLELRQLLRHAVQQEAYERAAELRDLIRQKEQIG